MMKSENSWNDFILPKTDWLDFYVLVCNSANFGPIFDFKVSTDSLDPGDFKNGLKNHCFNGKNALKTPRKNDGNFRKNIFSELFFTVNLGHGDCKGKKNSDLTIS